MPKERRASNSPPNPSRVSPYTRKPDRVTAEDVKQWEEAQCPICIEHPHSAVLLKCSSHDKGCMPYICDTSHRLSNCLDQFRNLFTTSSPLQCPLCRGTISNSIVIEAARQLMNSKPRICPREGCEFVGTYQELRDHARAQHPLARPSQADSDRERQWARLQEETAFGDLTSIASDGNHDLDLFHLFGSTFFPAMYQMIGTGIDDVNNLRPRRRVDSLGRGRRHDDRNSLRPSRPDSDHDTRFERMLRPVRGSEHRSRLRPEDDNDTRIDRMLRPVRTFHTRNRVSHYDTRVDRRSRRRNDTRNRVPETYHGHEGPTISWHDSFESSGWRRWSHIQYELPF